MDTVVKLDKINKSYGKGEGRVNVLKNVSLNVKRGEFVAILGPSGSGKSTLMNIIGLIDSYDSGDYFLDDINIREKKDKQYAKIRNEKVGFIFQKFNLIAKYSALYNVALPLLLKGESSRKAKESARIMLEKVGLGNRMTHKPNQLSGGQQQRVAIARALVCNASLILADEPTGNLDQRTGVEVIENLVSLNKEGKTILLITHDLNVASKATRVVRIEDGTVLEGSG